MGPFNTRELQLVVVLSATLGLIACSDVNFDQGAGSAGSNQAAGDGVDGNLGQPAGPGSGSGAGDGTDGNIGQPADPNAPPGGVGGTGPVNNPPGGVTPPGGTVPPGTPVAPAAVIPRVVFIGPPCIRGTNCQVIFELDQPYAQAVDYDWVTNDTAYLTKPQPAPDMLVARPNYHYVPTSGHITFAPGTVRKVVYVQNINPDNVKIQIWLRFSRCAYGGASLDCTAIFR